jgi:hypothetical protein
MLNFRPDPILECSPVITRYSRVSASWPVTIQTIQGVSEGMVENVSLSGAFIACKHEPDLLETVDLTIEVPEQALPLNLTATVVRRDAQGVAVTFVKLPESVQRFLNKVVTNRLLSEFGDCSGKGEARSGISDPLTEALERQIFEYGIDCQEENE